MYVLYSENQKMKGTAVLLQLIERLLNFSEHTGYACYT